MKKKKRIKNRKRYKKTNNKRNKETNKNRNDVNNSLNEKIKKEDDTEKVQKSIKEEVQNHTPEDMNGSLEKKGKKSFFINTLDVIYKIVAIVTFISLIIAYRQYIIDVNNRGLVFCEEIKLKYDSDNNYSVEFQKEQGGIKKAYLADVSYNGINYKCLNSKLEDCKLEFNSLDINSEMLSEELHIADIKHFAVVIQDTTNNWHIFYYIVQPEIDFDNLSYRLCVTIDGKEYANETELKKNEMHYIVLDCNLINKSTIEKELNNSTLNFTIYLEPFDVHGPNGEIFESNPRIEVPYTKPDTEEIYTNIQQIREDIKSSML